MRLPVASATQTGAAHFQSYRFPCREQSRLFPTVYFVAESLKGFSRIVYFVAETFMFPVSNIYAYPVVTGHFKLKDRHSRKCGYPAVTSGGHCVILAKAGIQYYI